MAQTAFPESGLIAVGNGDNTRRNDVQNFVQSFEAGTMRAESMAESPVEVPGRIRPCQRWRMTTSNESMSRSLIPAAAATLVFLLLTIMFFMSSDLHEKSGPSVAGMSVEGRPIEYWTFGNGNRVVFFMASIHGSEGAGTPLLEKLIEWLGTAPRELNGNQVIVMPVANPDGLHHGRRSNVRGVDLNRNFPARNRRDSNRFGKEAAPETETVALIALLERFRPAVTVSIHQPLECVDYDGPPEAAQLAEQMAAACELPVRKLGARPGSLGAWLGEDLQRPVLTMELPAVMPPDPGRLWQVYGNALTAVIAGR